MNLITVLVVLLSSLLVVIRSQSSSTIPSSWLRPWILMTDNEERQVTGEPINKPRNWIELMDNPSSSAVRQGVFIPERTNLMASPLPVINEHEQLKPWVVLRPATLVKSPSDDGPHQVDVPVEIRQPTPSLRFYQQETIVRPSVKQQKPWMVIPMPSVQDDYASPPLVFVSQQNELPSLSQPSYAGPVAPPARLVYSSPNPNYWFYKAYRPLEWMSSNNKLVAYRPGSSGTNKPQKEDELDRVLLAALTGGMSDDSGKQLLQLAIKDDDQRDKEAHHQAIFSPPMKQQKPWIEPEEMIPREMIDEDPSSLLESSAQNWQGESQARFFLNLMNKPPILQPGNSNVTLVKHQHQNKWSTETVTVFNTTVTTLTRTVQTAYCFTNKETNLLPGTTKPICSFRRRRRSTDDEASLLMNGQPIRPSSVEKILMTQMPAMLESRAVQLEGSNLDDMLESRGQMQRFLSTYQGTIPSIPNFKGQPTVTSYITVPAYVTEYSVSTTVSITFSGGSCIPQCLAALPSCTAFAALSANAP